MIVRNRFRFSISISNSNSNFWIFLIFFQRLTFVFIQFDVCFFSVLVQLNVFWKMCEEDRGGGELRWEFQSAAFVNEGQNATELNLRRSSNSVFEVTTKVAPHSHRSAKMSTHNEGTYAAAVLERLKKWWGIVSWNGKCQRITRKACRIFATMNEFRKDWLD